MNVAGVEFRVPTRFVHFEAPDFHVDPAHPVVGRVAAIDLERPGRAGVERHVGTIVEAGDGFFVIEVVDSAAARWN